MVQDLRCGGGLDDRVGILLEGFQGWNCERACGRAREQQQHHVDEAGGSAVRQC